MPNLATVSCAVNLFESKNQEVKRISKTMFGVEAGVGTFLAVESRTSTLALPARVPLVDNLQRKKGKERHVK